MTAYSCNFGYEQIAHTATELKNMESNKLGSPWQADGKHCMHDVLFLTFIWLVKGVSVHVTTNPSKSFYGAGPIIMQWIGRWSKHNVFCQKMAAVTGQQLDWQNVTMLPADNHD